jgi:phosphate transport system substrate-binding protein
MRRTSSRARRALLQLTPVIVVALLVGIAATDSGGSGDGPAQARDGLTGSVRIDGAAALRSLVDRAAERFQSTHPDVRVTVGASGDESAIALFCAGEIDIAAVARRLDRAERHACRTSETDYSEIKVAREGIALVVSEQNRFVHCLSLEQARAIWRRTNPAATWAEVDPRFPAVPFEAAGWKPDSPPATMLAQALYGPVDPLTRDDYEVADDAKDLSKLVAPSPYAVGYLPIVQLNPSAGVRPVALDAGRGCVAPSAESVGDGSYPVLTRPLNLEVRSASLRRPEARRFVRDFVARPPALTKADGAVATPSSHRVHWKFTRP